LEGEATLVGGRRRCARRIRYQTKRWPRLSPLPPLLYARLRGSKRRGRRGSEQRDGVEGGDGVGGREGRRGWVAAWEGGASGSGWVAAWEGGRGAWGRGGEGIYK
jgi:hypothetical protein